jgi:hypothetical protein
MHVLRAARVITYVRASVDLSLREWLDRLLVDEVIRRSEFKPWECQQWDNAWYEQWITTFFLPPEDF